MRSQTRIKIGFTLIELLIVVAIIAILAAIAVPNFLEAQVRSKTARVKADLRTLATAVESYLTDHNTYISHMLIEQTIGAISDPWNPYDPSFSAAPGSWNEFHFSRKISITTPVAYITSVPLDPFYTTNAPVNPGSTIIAASKNPIRAEYMYSFSKQSAADAATVDAFMKAYGSWRLWSGGPDRFRREIFLRSPASESMRIYDPTNGSISVGDIWRTQKSPDGSRPVVPGYVE
ncbi:MAG: prepilin-type N-terminal cleavage/methylation domain-containing protein [bacterium]